MIRLALLRHGHTSWNRQGRIQGRSDIALDLEAEARLGALALPDDWRAATIWSSPLQRAVTTARLVTGTAPLTSLALTEMDWGDWEGKKGKELQADPTSGFRDIEDWGWDFRPPNGESPAEVRARLKPWVQSLSGDTVAVCHIGIMRVLLAQASGWGFTGPAPFRIKRDRLFIISIRGNTWSANAAPVRLVERNP